MSQLQEGSCVIPLSGGPVMVIFSIKGLNAFCRWVNGRKLESAIFPLSELAEAPRSPSSPDKIGPLVPGGNRI
jgi:hypothetical protein